MASVVIEWVAQENCEQHMNEDKERNWEQNVKLERKNMWQVDWLVMWMWYWSVGVCVCCNSRPDMIYMGYLSGAEKKVNEAWARTNRHRELNMRTDREQIWESWWLVMLMWNWHVGLYVKYRISIMHLSWDVSNTQRLSRKLPVRGDMQVQVHLNRRTMWLTCPTPKQWCSVFGETVAVAIMIRICIITAPNAAQCTEGNH